MCKNGKTAFDLSPNLKTFTVTLQWGQIHTLIAPLFCISSAPSLFSQLLIKHAQKQDWEENCTFWTFFLVCFLSPQKGSDWDFYPTLSAILLIYYERDTFFFTIVCPSFFTLLWVLSYLGNEEHLASPAIGVIKCQETSWQTKIWTGLDLLNALVLNISCLFLLLL